MKLAEVEGLGILEFPDDTPDSVISQTVKRELRNKSVAEDKARIRRELAQDTESPVLVGIGRGMYDVGQGIKQLGLQAGEKLGLVNQDFESLITGKSKSQEYTSDVEEELRLYQKLSDAYPVRTGGGRIIGNVAVAPIPGGVGAKALTRIGTAALSGGVSAGLTFTPENESRLRKIAFGALSGAGLQGAVGEPLRLLGRGLASTPEQAAERAVVAQAGKTAGVPVRLTDVTQSPITKELDVLAEKAGPLGTAPGRLRQAEAARGAAQDFLARTKGNYQLGDVSDEIRVSLQDRLGRFQKVKSAKYARAAKVADQAGDIPTPRFDQTINQSISEIQSRGIASPELVSALEAAKAAPRGPFSTLNALDDDLGETVSSFYRGGENAAIAKKGVQYFQAAKQALRADIESHLSVTRPGALPLIKEADEFYRNNILPFKRTQLSKIVSNASDFNPELAWKFVERNAGSPTMMRALYTSLTPNGRVAVKSGLLKEAIERGTVSPQQGGAPVFSPGRVAGYLEDKIALADTFMNPADAAEFRGLVKLFRAIQRSGQVGENPPTGARLVLPALIASSFWSPGNAAMVGGGLLVAKGVFQTELARKMLTTLAELPVDHPRTITLINQIATTLRTRIPGALIQPEVTED